MQQRQLDSLRHQLWQTAPPASEHQLYAILDAARDPRIYQGLVDSDCAYQCLYRGDLADELREVAPYLVHLQPQAPLTEWLLNLGWGDSWGIFLASAADMRDLRRHFRRFLMVYSEDGKPLYFRYYDPRVLRLYLPTCNAAEVLILFGPVARYYVEGEGGDTLIEFTQDDGRLRQRTLRLDDLAS
jgi:hypothetical protein